MPKATVDEYHRPVPAQHQIWCARQIAFMQPKSVSETVNH